MFAGPVLSSAAHLTEQMFSRCFALFLCLICGWEGKGHGGSDRLKVTGDGSRSCIWCWRQLWSLGSPKGNAGQNSCPTGAQCPS